MYLNQFGQQPKQRPKRGAMLAGGGVLLAAAAAVTAVLLLRPADDSGQTGRAASPATTTTEASTAAATSQAPPPSPSQLPGDAITREACADAEALYNRAGDLTEQDAIRAIGVKAQKSSIPDAQTFGTQMVTKADAAIKNKGKDAELTTTLEAAAVATNFATWCVKGGYVKP